MIPVTLWLLASLDAMFVGFRDAAGRNPYIGKSAYVRDSLARGLVWGQAIIVLGAVVILAAHALGPSAEQVWDEHLRAASSMLMVYGPYAGLVLVALAIYAIPSADISSLATVLILGPFTAARPLVIIAGAGLALSRGGLDSAAASVLVGSALMLGLPRLMARRWRGHDPIGDAVRPVAR